MYGGRYVCTVCHGNCDPEDLIGGICYECRTMIREKKQETDNKHTNENRPTADED